MGGDTVDKRAKIQGSDGEQTSFPVVVLGGGWHLLFKLCLAAVSTCLPLIVALMAYIVPSVIKNNAFREQGDRVTPAHIEAVRGQIEARHADAKWFTIEQVQALNKALDLKLDRIEDALSDLRKELKPRVD